MTKTICAEAEKADAPRRRRLAVAAFVGLGQFMRRALALFERDVGVGEANPNQE